LFKKLRVCYEKRGLARYFGHLEHIKIFIRAFRRARIPLRFSEGFHPAPKVSFESAIPVGTESLEEHFTVQVPVDVSRETIMERVNQELPQGLAITDCGTVNRRPPEVGPKLIRYTVTLGEGTFSEAKLKNFLAKTAWPFTKTNQKGRSKKIDLRCLVREFGLVSQVEANMILEGESVRPTDVLGSVFDLSEEALKLASVVKG
jgi:radical SAM-linked protein